MSLAGQWRGFDTDGYQVILDLDEFADHYGGTASRWIFNQNLPCAYTFVKLSKEVHRSRQLIKLRISYVDQIGYDLTDSKINEWEASGYYFDRDMEFNVSYDSGSIFIKWSSRGHEASVNLKNYSNIRLDVTLEDSIKTWDGFKNYVNRLDYRRFIFRGHESNRWSLKSTFYRAGRSDLYRYAAIDCNDLANLMTSSTGQIWKTSDELQYAALLNLAQHHGYPTPLLDWTWSPYVAAFFAYRKISGVISEAERVRIYLLDADEWNKLPRVSRVVMSPPHVSILQALPLLNNRMISQQAISTLSNVDVLESHIRGIENSLNKTFLRAIDLPANERGAIMKDLELMGITAGSMFPGLDGGCEALMERNFRR